MLQHRYVIVVRKARAQTLSARFASADLARFSMQTGGESYESYAREESLLEQALTSIRRVAEDLGPTLVIERSLLPGTPLTASDLLIAIGQDGLVANVLRYSGELPILGVNPDPESYEGTLLHFRPDEAASYLQRPQDTHVNELITIAEGRFGNGAIIRAANDIFIGKSDHSSALYRICHSDKEEQQSSSGVIVSTPMGATGWQRSVIEGSLRVLQSIGARNVSALKQKPVPRDADRLRFWVREPWPSLKSSSGIVAGVAQAHSPLTIVSQMGEGGAVFADGMQSDSYPFPAGEKLVIRPAAYKGRLVRNPDRLPSQGNLFVH